MIVNDVDTALSKFKELSKNLNKGLTEADTRAKLIDPVFKLCLGWVEEDICREPYSNPGYIDYVFSIDGVRRFVVEAKKDGETFAIPDSLSGKYYVISGTIWTNKKIREAIEQAQKYCISCGVNYGVVSNGHQYIIFESFRRGGDWKAGNCVVFHSFDDIENNFGLFWDILNKNSVKNGSLRRLISKESGSLKYCFRPRDRLHAKSAPRNRNNLSPILFPISEYFFNKITEENKREMLENCYVFRRQYQNATGEISRHFDSAPEFAKKYSAQEIIESIGNPSSFNITYEKLDSLSKSNKQTGSLIILMGGIGSGKTTFIHHFFSVTRPKNAVWFNIDFFNVPENPDKIEEYVVKIILEQFNLKYRKSFSTELSTLKMDNLRPELEDIKALFSFLSLRGFIVSLVLDNVDQHSYHNAKYQEQALLVANRLTNYLNTITILSLREESYFRSAMAGVLDSFPAQTFHISSPRFEELIRRRIDYVIGLLERNDPTLLEIVKDKNAVDSYREIAKTFFKIVGDSLRSTRRVGNEILMFMNEVSGCDMRLALYFFRTFLVSGNTDVDEMLNINAEMEQKGLPGYQIPFHHVIKSIILEHSRLYQMTRSKIMNVFDFDPGQDISHFTHLRILNYLYNRLSYNPAQGRGFVSIDIILDEADRVGVMRSAMDDSMKALAKYGLIEFENQSKLGYDDATFVRISNTGIYYFRYLIRDFAYLDIVWMDTPITEPNTVSELLKHVVELRPVKLPIYRDERFYRTEVFLKYLVQSEKTEMENHMEFRDSDLTKSFFMPEIIKEYETEKDYIVLGKKKNP
jgi:hypothetical protein